MTEFLATIVRAILRFFRLFAVGNMPYVPNLRLSNDDRLPDPGKTMGTLVVGRPGSGKTTYVALDLVEYMKAHPTEAIFVLDWSGSITDTILTLILMEPSKARDSLLERIVYDELGNPDYVVPLPEFSEAYGFSFEEEVQRVSANQEKMHSALVTGATVMGGLALEGTPHFLRLLTAIRNEHNECWQITEAKKLMVDISLLKKVVKEYGHRYPESKWFIEKLFIPLKPQERDRRTYAPLTVLSAIEPPSARARVGYSRPGWTPKDAIKKGQIVLINGGRLINQPKTQNYLFTQAYSLIMAEIQKRVPGNPKDEPVTIVLDEVFALLSIPGMADEIAKAVQFFRSRGVQITVVLQAFSQVAKPLDQQIYSLGNKVIFGLENKVEAEVVAHQLCNYDPRYMKLPAVTSTHNSVSEPERGQDRQIADWIHNFKFRECIIQRFMSEREKDKYLRYIPRTKEIRHASMAEPLQNLKDRLLRTQGVSIRDALAVINNRKLPTEKNNSRPPTI